MNSGATVAGCGLIIGGRHNKVSNVAQTGKVNLADKLALGQEHWSPKTVGEMKDYELKVVKVQGEFTWHKHDETDEFFLVIEGRLTIRLRDGEVVLEPGELFVVPKGVEHCPYSEGETQILLIQPKGVVNTGDAGGELTARSRPATVAAPFRS